MNYRALIWTCVENPWLIPAGSLVLSLAVTGIIILIAEFCDD